MNVAFIKARLVVFALLLLACAPTAAAAAPEPPFDWTMSGQLGSDKDGDGLIDYANSAAEFLEKERRRDGFEVGVKVRPDLCKKGAAYTWEVAAGSFAEGSSTGCRASLSFPTEGRHPVRLIVRHPGGRVQRFDREVDVQDWLIVSIGDSVAAGEGNPDREGGLLPGKRSRALWESPRCHRSAYAGSAQAALNLEAADERTATTFVHLGCSGAEIGTGLLKGYRGIDVDRFTEPELLPPQVQELELIAAAREVDAVLLSVGGNDVYFGPIVKFCLFKRNCMRQSFSPPEQPGSPRLPARPLPEVVEAALGRLPAAYAELAERLSEVTNPERVLVLEYFDPTRDSRGRFCRSIGFRNPFGAFQIDAAEAEWAATKLLKPLNALIDKAARDAGWTGVTGIAEAFGAHGYCADDSWIVRLGRAAKIQKGASWKSRFSGGFHPNEEGHRLEAAMIGIALGKVLYADAEAGAGGDPAVAAAEEDRGGSEGGAGDWRPTGAVVLVGLLAVLAAGTATAVWRRPREKRVENAGWLPSLPPPREEPDSRSVDAFGALVQNQAAWVHRRVEAVELVDDRVVRRRVSVDFTPGELPDLPSPTYAPIALLAKKVFTRFDLRDEEGRSVPLATREQNAALATTYMLRLAQQATGEAPSARLRELCWQVASGEHDEAWAAVSEMAYNLEPEQTRLALKGSEDFRAAATSFASNFAVIVKVDDPDKRRIVKFAYDQSINEEELSRRERLGLDPASINIELPELGDARGRHVEFVRTDGLEFWSDSLRVDLPDGRVVHRTGGGATGGAHLSVSRMPAGSEGVAKVLLRANRSGILAWGPWLALLAAIALTAAWFALPALAADSGGGAASILLAVPATFGAYLSARPSHAMEEALLLGARCLVFSAAALAFLGATALALTHSVEILRVALGVVALLSWLPAAGLVVTYFSPRPDPN